MPNKFKHRSYESELLDTPHIPKELLFQNLRELDLVVKPAFSAPPAPRSGRWSGVHGQTKMFWKTL